MKKDFIIYGEYLKAKASGESMTDLTKRLGLSRSTLYLIIGRVKNGDKVKLKACFKESGLACLWEHKYRSRAEALPDDRTAGTVKELKAIIRGMKRDKFSSAEIGRRLGKHHSTVLSHFKQNANKKL